MVGSFAAVQATVQIIGFLTGIILVRELDQHEYAYFTIAGYLNGKDVTGSETKAQQIARDGGAYAFTQITQRGKDQARHHLAGLLRAGGERGGEQLGPVAPRTDEGGDEAGEEGQGKDEEVKVQDIAEILWEALENEPNQPAPVTAEFDICI